jgi:hypothetical protein
VAVASLMSFGPGLTEGVHEAFVCWQAYFSVLAGHGIEAQRRRRPTTMNKHYSSMPKVTVATDNQPITTKVSLQW